MKKKRFKLSRFIADLKYTIGRKISDIECAVKKPFRFIAKVWYFRKVLWDYSCWDYQYNLNLLIRSLENSADFYESGKCIAVEGDEKAKEIRQFIHFIECSQDPFDEAEKVSGITYEDAHKVLHGRMFFEDDSGNFLKKDKKTLRREQHDYVAYNEKVKEIEKEYWDQGMNLLRERMRYWWD